MSTAATPEGTRRYAQRFPDAVRGGHFREAVGLAISSIGLGTYLGDPDDETDARYTEAALQCLRRGVNFLDAAVNYRYQRSERNLGEALRRAIAEGSVRRDEVVLCTKGGFLPLDGTRPDDPHKWIRERFIDSGILDPDRDIVGGCHAMTPRYLEDQIGTSLRNLGVDCIDIYYLHNPETQVPVVGPQEFYRRLRTAFEWLEEEVRRGRVRWYGTATWNGYRVPEHAPDHLDLGRVVAMAEAAGGKNHHFRFLQCPVNLAMLEAAGVDTQEVDGRRTMLFEAAAVRGVHVISSASILQGKLALGLPPEIRERIPELPTDALRSLQIVRSLPGLTSALVGMSSPEHVEENLTLVGVPLLPSEVLGELFSG